MRPRHNAGENWHPLPCLDEVERASMRPRHNAGENENWFSIDTSTAVLQ